ncbi:MAG: fumarate hydratase [Deltaproteobacteria bacterium]|nr:fumarate hydratase [Deltaproteobacteria bacterium]MCF8119956.1 fumarate hydratase [Deltaproteobacteria bacterium]
MIRGTSILDAARELNVRAAIDIPKDAYQKVEQLSRQETNRLSSYVLGKILENYDAATKDRVAMCADTGLPRYYVKIGNDAVIEGGMVQLEKALRQATADTTVSIPLRPNRVHPFTRKDNNNNVGMHAPTVDYSFEPDVDWVDITVTHKGGLFGGDYRMLFPADGIPGLKRFFLDSLAEFLRRGMACQPATIGVGVGGTKDMCVRLAKEAACLRIVGDRNPDPEIAKLEEELAEIGTSAGFGPMGFQGNSAVLDVHIEVAYAHTGGMPVGIQQFCYAQRRKTVRIFPDNSIEYREDPRWFTPYYRRETIE